MKYRGIRVSCVDNFQGTERDFIILSLVRTNSRDRFGFITDDNRINISLTRARKGLFIVGNINAIETSNKFGDRPMNMVLIKLCQFYKELGAVVSFDKLEKISKIVDLRIKVNFMHPLPLKKLENTKDKQSNFWDDVFVNSENNEKIQIDKDSNELDIADFCYNEIIEIDDEYDE